MQGTKLETHINFDRNLDTQNALTIRLVANEINLSQNVLKQLEFFTQNNLSKHMSYKTLDDSTTEKRGYRALTCLGKSKIIT